MISLLLKNFETRCQARDAPVAWVGVPRGGRALGCASASLLAGYRPPRPDRGRGSCGGRGRRRTRRHPTFADVEVSVASLVCIFAAVVFGPLAGGRRRGSRPACGSSAARWSPTGVAVAHLDIDPRHCGGRRRPRAVVVVMPRPGLLGALRSRRRRVRSRDARLDLALTLVAPAIRGTSKWMDTVSSVGPPLLGSVPIQAPLIAVLASRTRRSRRGVSRSSRFQLLRRNVFTFCIGSSGTRPRRSRIANARLGGATSRSRRLSWLRSTRGTDTPQVTPPRSRSTLATSLAEWGSRSRSKNSCIFAGSSMTSGRSASQRASREARSACAR